MICLTAALMSKLLLKKNKHLMKQNCEFNSAVELDIVTLFALTNHMFNTLIEVPCRPILLFNFLSLFIQFQ